MPKINNIVLVHGGFVDGAGWRGVYDILKKVRDFWADTLPLSFPARKSKDRRSRSRCNVRKSREAGFSSRTSGGRIVSQKGRNLQRHPAIHTLGPVIDAAEQVRRASQILESQFKEQGFP